MARVIAPSSPADSAAPSDPSGPVDVPVDGTLLALALRVAQEEAGSADRVGGFLGARPEDDVARTLSFAALDPGYRGWRWSVTVAQVGDDAPTVSEVLLLPGSDALVPPPWLPWSERVRGQDVGPGDLHPVGPDDERLVPGYLESDDPAIQDVALEVGLGRTRVLGVLGRWDAAERWHAGEFGPETAMAEQAPASCISCGFYVPLAGALGAALGACANEYSPADGRVVDAAYGCGAHSETEIDMPMLSALPDIALDDGVLDIHPRGGVEAAPEVGTTGTVETQVVVSAEVDESGSILTEPLFDDAVVVEPTGDEVVADVEDAVDAEVQVGGPLEISDSEPVAEDSVVVEERAVAGEPVSAAESAELEEHSVIEDRSTADTASPTGSLFDTELAEPAAPAEPAGSADVASDAPAEPISDDQR